MNVINILAILVIIILVLLLLYYMYLKYNYIQKDSNSDINSLRNNVTPFSIHYNEIIFGKRLGQGSQGEVFKGIWRGTIVAVKKVDVRNVDNDTIKEFCQETNIMRNLRHPNVCLFMGVCLDHPHICIVSEFIERGSLFDLMRLNNSALSWIKSLNIALDIARGCTYLHEHSPPIIHRDLKSLNILIDKNWKAKIADFGMTRIQDDATMTQCGSPLWMAPEMIKNTKAYNEKVDVFSFGIILWELYTRLVPYSNTGIANPAELCSKVVRDDMRPEIPYECPQRYSRLINACWHSIPGRRPSFRQVVKIIEGFLKDPIITSHRPVRQKNNDENKENNNNNDDDDNDESIIENKGQLDSSTIKENISKAFLQSLNANKNILQDASDNKQSTHANQTDQDVKKWMVDVKSELKVTRKLTSTRSADVYEGEYRGQKVAVKVWQINLEAADTSEELIFMINDVMDSVSLLRHPNIVLFMGAFVEDNTVGVIEELMSRGSIADLIREKKISLDWDIMLQFLIDAAHGLAYLHGTQPPSAHGDLKSTRLLVDQNWRVKISGAGYLDFESSVQAVTPSVWQAPEVLIDPENGLPASNSYSFGMIMYHVLTGTAPYDEVNNDEIFSNIIDGARPELPESIPRRLQHLIRMCWNADINRRPTLDYILSQLTKLKEEGPSRLELTDFNSNRYHKASTVYAYCSKDPIKIFKEWGQNRGAGGDYVIVGKDNDVYMCDRDVFQHTYEHIKGNEYRKIGTIRAKKIQHTFYVKTHDVVEHGIEGDYLVQNEEGDQWIIDGNLFNDLYTIH